MDERKQVVASALAAAVERNLGTAAIENLQRLSGGASADTWSFDVMREGERLELILRVSIAGKQDPYRIDSKTEARLLALAYEADVPVPRVLFHLEEKDGVGFGYVMEKINGETIARKILQDDLFDQARSRMARQCGEILYRLHSIDVDVLPPIPNRPARVLLDDLYNLFKVFDQDRPIFELAFRWLNDHVHVSKTLTLVHGDFRNGNFIVGPEGIRAVLDWEMAHLGNPMEDLGWICVNSWRFGNIKLPVGGFGHREDLFAGYESAGGSPVDLEEVHFWEVLGTLKWGVGTLFQAFTHLSGMKRSVELAAVGRRASETELDLLSLLAAA